MTVRSRDLCAGVLMALVGVAVMMEASTYGIGNLQRIKPGFFPVVLGAILSAIGLFTAVTSFRSAEEVGAQPPPVSWRGVICIFTGLLSFILFAKFGGMAPATFACVLIAARGDQTSTWRGAMSLAGGVTVFVVILFYYVLHIPLPPFGWNNQ